MVTISVSSSSLPPQCTQVWAPRWWPYEPPLISSSPQCTCMDTLMVTIWTSSSSSSPLSSVWAHRWWPYEPLPPHHHHNVEVWTHWGGNISLLHTGGGDHMSLLLLLLLLLILLTIIISMDTPVVTIWAKLSSAGGWLSDGTALFYTLSSPSL